MNVKIILMSVAVAIAASLPMKAQNGTVSPYSRFGYGLLSDRATAMQSQMGGVGYAMFSGRQINVMNPASYARVDSLTFLFDIGFKMSNAWHEETPEGTRVSDNIFGGGLGYITMQFPVSKNIGVSVGLIPWSSVGYNIGNLIENGYTTRSGDGSINELYAGIGGRIMDRLSVGVNISYMFGNANNYTYAATDMGSTSLYYKEMSIRDYNISAGLLYLQPIGRRDVLSVGLTYSPAKKFIGKARTYVQDVNNETSPTLQDKVDLQDNYSRAASYGIGVGYTWRNRLMVEADFTYQPWSKEKFQGLDDMLADRYKVGLGLQFRPAVRGSYVKRIEYRLGGFVERNYQKIFDADGAAYHVRDYGVSMGFGFPIPGYKTVVNLGFEWRHRQATPRPLVKENYLNITLGVNFNEAWFFKNKIY